MKKKKEKIVYKEDDGRTLFDMSGLSQKSSTHNKEKNNNTSGVYLTKKERRAVIIAGLKHYLPMLLTGLLGFAIAIILIYLWLS